MASSWPRTQASRLLQKLALEFRASMIASNLRRTTRLMILALGEDVFRMILAEYRNRVTPRMFAGTEARAFARFIQELGVGVPQLAEVLEFELAVLETLLDGTNAAAPLRVRSTAHAARARRRPVARPARTRRAVRDRDHASERTPTVGHVGKARYPIRNQCRTMTQ